VSLIEKALYIALSQRNASYLNVDDLAYVAQEIGKPILLVHAEATQEEERQIVKMSYADNEIQGGTLHNLNGSKQSFREEDIYVNGSQLKITKVDNQSRIDVRLPQNCLIIIKTEQHFHVNVSGLRKREKQKMGGRTPIDSIPAPDRIPSTSGISHHSDSPVSYY
jgi:hypothetical protein